ncbi:fasciclin domain-containing protein [Nocardioides houyundeii]|uniref:fasciclin domain-containing protein n=1 Tax=Nocardioides houyundeii TaxID=2045452 RepID=UPI000C7784C6|nr:fasciclin domain-containing protein [Nocardioides houyundeii]
MKRLTMSLVALATSATVIGGALPAQAQSQAQAPKEKEKSLVQVLTSDGNRFDKNKADFDILTEAALAIVAAKPDSPVALLADGSVKLTAFAPTDQAFRLLAKDLTGKTIRNEEKLFTALVDLAGVDTIETVLLYHVVPGSTLNSKKVLKSNNARLTTAQGGKVKVKIGKNHEGPVVRLVDKDRDAKDPKAILGALDINKGNKQIAHGIDRVLRPINL